MTYEKAYKEYKDNLFGVTKKGIIVFIPTLEDLCCNIATRNCDEIDIRNYCIYDLEFPEFEKINPKYQKIYNNFLEDKTNMVINIVKESLFFIQEKFNRTAFIESLTYNEKQAFSAIAEHLENDSNSGYVSISKLVEETKISRPVFKNLMIKMQNNNIAEISNSGVKGTYIKMLVEVK